MAFASNPLSLSVPEPAFESWLRDSGYLELLDHRTTELHRSITSSSTSPASTTATSSTSATPTTTLTAVAYLLVMSFVSSLTTLLSLFTLNPLSKLTADDFSDRNAATWKASGFVGSADSYSFPSSSTQARMRVHENVKRFARNYATLLIVFFACALYQMPLALVGLLSCLTVWEVFRFCDERWGFDRYPTARQVLIRVAQCVVAVLLFYFNIQMAVFSALAVAYAVMMLHASFRKLTPSQQPSKGRGR